MNHKNYRDSIVPVDSLANLVCKISLLLSEFITNNWKSHFDQLATVSSSTPLANYNKLSTNNLTFGPAALETAYNT